MGVIRFFSEDINFSLPQKLQTKSWINLIINSEGALLNDLNIIFCSDDYLHKLNLQYLQHDDYTDILTFDKIEEKGKVSGDIFISIERVKENADNLNQEFILELKRVIIHGIFHLLGYKDKHKNQKKIMTQKENEALNLLSTI
ncbi:MAG: rRNA maturation RNase YbeY [Bacteroidota bacterium]|nr:rRNA maturation RNase YbeY [Bacteroidota bacterium]